MRTLLILLLLPLTTSFAQPPTGAWRQHLPMNGFSFIGETTSSILAANKFGVLRYNKSDESIEPLTKVNGLSEVSITFLFADTVSNQCLIGYDNGDLDIIKNNGTVINQPAIKRASNSGSKRIHSITRISDKLLILSGQGISTIDAESYFILETTSILLGEETAEPYQLISLENKVYLLSSLGLLTATVDGNNLANLNWSSINMPVTPENIAFIFPFDTTIYALHNTGIYNNDTLYQLENNQLTIVEPLLQTGINSAQAVGQNLLVCHDDRISLYDEAFNETKRIFTYGDNLGLLPQRAILSKNQDQIKIADAQKGCIFTSFSNQFNSTILKFNSPIFPDVQNLKLIEGTIYAFTGGNEFSFDPSIYHILQDQEWQSIRLSDQAGFEYLANCVDAAFSNDQLYIASARHGLVRTSASDIKQIYTDSNSTIEDLSPETSYDFFGITAIEADDVGNLWMVNHKAQETLKIKYTDGSWASVDLNHPEDKTNQMLRLRNGLLAINITDKGFVLFSDNNTPKNLSDDRFVNITTSPTSGALPSGLVTSFAEDRDGELWVGTSAGIAVLYNPLATLDDPTQGAQKIIVNQDGYNGFLFATETVTAIAVDGGNRKWVGTSSSGVYLISPDGTEQILAFNEDNSPLISNNIRDIEIEPKTGEVFIATDLGLVSYRSDATEGAETEMAISVFPNPVRPNNSVPITINGMSEGSKVRITDAAGRLVFETVSQGGTAIWDQQTRFGQRAPAGVYLVYATSSDGVFNGKGKFLILDY